MKTFDTTKYITIPYKNKGRDFDGADCWGLVRLVYKEEYGIDLISFDNQYQNASDSKRVKEVVKYGKDVIDYIQKDTPDFGDLIVFIIKGNPCHVGVYIGSNKVLHVLKGTDSTCERLNSGRLKGRVEGYYGIREQD